MPFDVHEKYNYSRDEIALRETNYLARKLLLMLHLANTLLIRGEAVIYDKLSCDNAAIHTYVCS